MVAFSALSLAPALDVRHGWYQWLQPESVQHGDKGSSATAVSPARSNEGSRWVSRDIAGGFLQPARA